MPWDPGFWTDSLNELTAGVLAWLPQLGAAIVLLLIGWLVARISQAILGGVLRRLGVDRLSERAGAAEVLTRIGWGHSASEVLARFVFWIVMLVFLLAATESLGLSGVVDTLRSLIDYLPRVLAAALILLIGGVIARIVGEAVSAVAESSAAGTGSALGRATQIALMVFVAILALQQLGIETTLLTATTVAAFGAVVLALAVAFGAGSRQLARNIMAGFHVREEFTIGQRLSVGGHAGTLTQIGSLKSRLQTDDGEVSIPNSLLAEEIVELTGNDV